MNILKMTHEEIKDFVDKLWNEKKEEIVDFFKKEIEEISKQDKKEYKSLSDYKFYKRPMQNYEYKYIDNFGDIETAIWYNDDCFSQSHLSVGNVYSIDTPNELLQREIKRHQLWFGLEQYLKEHDCLVTNEDWKDVEKMKYTVSYDIEHGCYDTCSCTTHKDNTIYSTCWEVLENYMDALLKEDVKIMFDIDID